MFLTFICRALTMTISKTFCWFLTCFLFLFSWFIFIMANENTYTHSFLSTNKLQRNSFYTLCYMLIVLKSFLWAKQNLTVFKIAIFSYSLLPKIFRFRRSSLRLVFLIKIVYNIVWTPPPPPPPPPSPPFSKQGGSKFWLPPREGESEKLEKRGGSMVQWQVLLSVCVGGGLTCFVFKFFKVYYFYI